jgi:hypothetical protein
MATAFRGKEAAVSSTSGEGGSIDLLFLDGSGRFVIVEVKLKPEELDKAVGQLRRHARLTAMTAAGRVETRRTFIPAGFRVGRNTVGQRPP